MRSFLTLAAFAALSTPALADRFEARLVAPTPQGGNLAARLIVDGGPGGVRWTMACTDEGDPRNRPARIRTYAGSAPFEAEWVVGTAPEGRFTLALRGRPLLATSLEGCPKMGVPTLRSFP
ncbi:hypothetical protein [Methylobacterium sp. J-092]|uniref:hypothetical protein n=1 Tax=Methylobacterium sp. J-092 TaxID=2836667 RepID=UPI001FBB60B6|nr:hypothetical protein [Methylobacterium sp. J-092]MCJ2007029.1 hypothetical protein [Methylobacterium sp. J-092]